MINGFQRVYSWGKVLINLCLNNFSETLANSLQLSGSLESWHCPQTFLLILPAVLCTMLSTARTLFQTQSSKQGCCVGLLSWSGIHLHQLSALAFQHLCWLQLNENSTVEHVSYCRKRQFIKKIEPKLTASQEKNAIISFEKKKR